MSDPHQAAMEFLALARQIAPQILFAILCGGLVGLERELKNKPAGMKTNILICMGSTVLTAMSLQIATRFTEDGYYGDPARIAAQIIPGIGFLGGGTIIQSRGTILGLTTAATIWVVAAIGITIGMGYGEIAVGVSVLVVLVLVATGFFEDRILGRSRSFAVEIVVSDPEGSVRLAINQALSQHELSLEDFDLRPQGDDTHLHLTFSGQGRDNKKFILDLWGMPGVKEVRQL